MTSERVYEPPTDEQLANFVCARTAATNGHPASRDVVEEFIRGYPGIKKMWLQDHREMQEAAWAQKETPNDE